MAGPWNDDNGGKEMYKDAEIIERKVGEALVDLDKGHWLKNGYIWSRPAYAYNEANKLDLGPNYYFLVKIKNKRGETAWAVIMLKQNKKDLAEFLDK